MIANFGMITSLADFVNIKGGPFDLKIANILESSGWIIHILEELVPTAIVNKITASQTMLKGEIDSLIWQLDFEGVFTTKST